MEENQCFYCNSPAKYYCTCVLPRVNFCLTHRDTHEMTEAPHTISLYPSTNLIPNPQCRLKLVNKILQVKKIAENQINSVLENTKERVSFIEHQSALALQKLHKFIGFCSSIIADISEIRHIHSKPIYNPIESILLSTSAHDLIEKITAPTIKFSPVNRAPSYTPSNISHLLYNYSDLSIESAGLHTLMIYPVTKLLTNATLDPTSRFLNIGNKKLLVTGGIEEGSRSRNNAFIIDIATESVKELKCFNKARKWHSMAWIDGYPAILAGNNNEETINSVESLQNNRWQEISPINIPRESFTSVTIHKEVWVIGGIYRNTLDSLERYKDGAWTVARVRLPIPLSSVGVCALENRLVLFGGLTKGKKAVNNSYCLDTENQEIMLIPSSNSYGSFPYSMIVVEADKVSGLERVEKEYRTFSLSLENIIY